MSQFTHCCIISLTISSKNRLGKQILLKIHRFRALIRVGWHAPEPELLYKQMHSVAGLFWSHWAGKIQHPNLFPNGPRGSGCWTEVLWQVRCGSRHSATSPSAVSWWQPKPALQQAAPRFGRVPSQPFSILLFSPTLPKAPLAYWVKGAWYLRSISKMRAHGMSLCESCKGPMFLPRTPAPQKGVQTPPHVLAFKPNFYSKSNHGSTSDRAECPKWRAAHNTAAFPMPSRSPQLQGGWRCSQLGQGGWLLVGTGVQQGAQAAKQKRTSPGGMYLISPNPEKLTANTQHLKKQTTGHKGTKGMWGCLPLNRDKHPAAQTRDFSMSGEKKEKGKKKSLEIANHPASSWTEQHPVYIWFPF